MVSFRHIRVLGIYWRHFGVKYWRHLCVCVWLICVSCSSLIPFCTFFVGWLRNKLSNYTNTIRTVFKCVVWFEHRCFQEVQRYRVRACGVCGRGRRCKTERKYLELFPSDSFHLKICFIYDSFEATDGRICSRKDHDLFTHPNFLFPLIKNSRIGINNGDVNCLFSNNSTGKLSISYTIGWRTR